MLLPISRDAVKLTARNSKTTNACLRRDFEIGQHRNPSRSSLKLSACGTGLSSGNCEQNKRPLLADAVFATGFNTKACSKRPRQFKVLCLIASDCAPSVELLIAFASRFALYMSGINKQSKCLQPTKLPPGFCNSACNVPRLLHRPEQAL